MLGFVYLEHKESTANDGEGGFLASACGLEGGLEKGYATYLLLCGQTQRLVYLME